MSQIARGEADKVTVLRDNLATFHRKFVTFRQGISALRPLFMFGEGADVAKLEAAMASGHVARADESYGRQKAREAQEEVSRSATWQQHVHVGMRAQHAYGDREGEGIVIRARQCVTVIPHDGRRLAACLRGVAPRVTPCCALD